MWAERARASRAVLVGEYWDKRTGLFRIEAGLRGRLGSLLPWGKWHFWWQAHGLEVLLDGYEAGDPAAGSRAAQLIRGVARRNHGDVTANDYYDDLAWMGLATLRAHDRGLIDARLPMALADAVADGWDARLGGVRWRVHDEFRNVAATAPSAMLLARASQVDGDARRLGIAREASDWLHSTLVEHSGIVWDGCRPREGVLVPEGRLWSYNVGTVVGLDVVLAGMSDEVESQRRLARAASVARAGSSALRAGCLEVGEAVALIAQGSADAAPDSGIWQDEVSDGTGADPQLFRGILARYTSDLVLADPTLTDIAPDLVAQAEAAREARDSRGRIGAEWDVDRQRLTRRGPAPTLAAHLSGALTLGSVARLERAGLT